MEFPRDCFAGLSPFLRGAFKKGVSFSFVTFLLDKQKKSKDMKEGGYWPIEICLNQVKLNEKYFFEF
jgi:hypothetical protein